MYTASIDVMVLKPFVTFVGLNFRNDYFDISDTAHRFRVDHVKYIVLQRSSELFDKFVKRHLDRKDINEKIL